MDQFPRLYALEVNKDCVIADRCQDGNWEWSWIRQINGGHITDQLLVLRCLLENVNITKGSDSWSCDLDIEGRFTVKSAHIHIDEVIIHSSNIPTQWNKYAPIKVNVLIWRVLLHKIPTRLNLSGRGIEVHSLLCPTCDRCVEDTNHVFLFCEVAAQIWS
ncbi:unnamed protein product [Lactuca saligna]|uniref:Reverse transcriptase zinc-binding domain-containing protein n=1 Tax=Lactuca saligna TaxID=75948 RepID=A0AA35VCI3_LACSI|nr:unnamed protein product [Lactuca saligna]